MFLWKSTNSNGEYDKIVWGDIGISTKDHNVSPNSYSIHVLCIYFAITRNIGTPTKTHHSTVVHVSYLEQNPFFSQGCFPFPSLNMFLFHVTLGLSPLQTLMYTMLFIYLNTLVKCCCFGSLQQIGLLQHTFVCVFLWSYPSQT